MAVQWTGIAIGAWVIVSPWLLGFSDISLAKWSNVITGGTLALVNVWSIFGKEAPPEGNRNPKS